MNEKRIVDRIAAGTVRKEGLDDLAYEAMGLFNSKDMEVFALQLDDYVTTLEAYAKKYDEKGFIKNVKKIEDIADKAREIVKVTKEFLNKKNEVEGVIYGPVEDYWYDLIESDKWDS